jgi:hypothetical protein
MVTSPDATAVPAPRPRMRYAGESIGTFVLVFAVGAELSSRAP